MSRSRARMPWSCAWSATGPVSVHVPSSSQAMVRSAEPGRPSLVEVPGDTELVGPVIARRHVDAPAGAERRAARSDGRGCGAVWRRITHSATARLITHAAPMARSPVQRAGAEQRTADAAGERLRPGGQADGVGADHPGAVPGDVAAADRGDAEDQAGDHRGAEHQAQHVEQGAGAGLRRVEQRHPERRAGDEQAGHGQDPTGTAVPAQVAATEPRHELEGTDDHVRAGADDVHHQREREAREPVVGRDQLGTAEQLDHPERAGQQRDDAEQQQGGRHRPAPLLPGAAGAIAPAVPDVRRLVIRRSRARRRVVTAAVCGGLGALVAPQGDAESDQGDPDRDGHRPVEGLGQDGQRGGRDGAHGEERGRPPGQDVGPGTGRCRR